MNNLFKSNSRFAALADETENKKKDTNSKKKDTKNDNKQNDSKSDNRFKEEKETNNRFKGAFETKEIEKVERPKERNQFQKPVAPEIVKPVEVKPIINADDFSNSISKSKSTAATEKKPTLSFAEKAAKNCNIGEIVRFTPIEKVKPKEVLDEDIIEKIKEQQMAYEVLDALCNLHEKRTTMYIERYGYDAWERTFKFEGWEEEEAYNKKLDDDYEEWLEKEEERELKEEEARYREEEYLANNDRYVNYWKYY
jgi:hypothetical protein